MRQALPPITVIAQRALLYKSRRPEGTLDDMDVAISVLRAQLSTWIERARAGEEIVVTDRGVPVARLSSIDNAPLIDALTREGVLSTPRTAGRPRATGAPRVRARGPVAKLVSEQRD